MILVYLTLDAHTVLLIVMMVTPVLMIVVMISKDVLIHLSIVRNVLVNLAAVIPLVVVCIGTWFVMIIMPALMIPVPQNQEWPKMKTVMK
jgi:hypothetical protein